MIGGFPSRFTSRHVSGSPSLLANPFISFRTPFNTLLAQGFFHALGSLDECTPRVPIGCFMQLSCDLEQALQHLVVVIPDNLSNTVHSPDNEYPCVGDRAMMFQEGSETDYRRLLDQLQGAI